LIGFSLSTKVFELNLIAAKLVKAEAPFNLLWSCLAVSGIPFIFLWRRFKNGFSRCFGIQRLVRGYFYNSSLLQLPIFHILFIGKHNRQCWQRH